MSPYRGARIALLTQHGKEALVGPVLADALGARVERVGGFDTDRLGTFTREIPRAGTQLEAARRKARIGMELSGLPVGLASEGAFGADPFAGLLPWDVELLVLVDDRAGMEVTAMAQGQARSAHRRAGSWGEAEAFAREAGFPEHALVLRPEGLADAPIRKGLQRWPDLEAAFAEALEASPGGAVLLENELRAHLNPTRQEVIRQASRDLAARLASPCPACGAPGFWTVERIPGRPCGACGAPTAEPAAEVRGCVRCDHRDTRPLDPERPADPGRCDFCNP